MCSDFSLNSFSPTYYTVYPMLSASGNLFKCHEEVLFYFFTCCTGIPILYTHIILCTQCYLHRGTCLNAMKRFYFIFYLLYWYSYIVYPEYFVCRGGGGIASSSLKKKLLLL